jgi:acetamidase/formamidase
VTVHTVESTSETVRSGVLDPSAAPVATIVSGDVVSYPHTWTHWGNEATFGMSFADREPLRHRYPNGPYSMLGPVEVVGAEPGDVIECRLVALRTIDWGWNSFPLGVGRCPRTSPSATSTTSASMSPAPRPSTSTESRWPSRHSSA